MNTCVLMLLICSYVNCSVYNSTLKLVHVFFRHGSRIPDEHELYSNDPYIDIFKQYGFGQLTKEGKQGSYELGKFLRKRYDNFLGPEFDSNTVSARTTDWHRTKMTALLVLAGLFPPSNKSRWSDNINWIPIPYSYNKDDMDYFFRHGSRYPDNHELYPNDPYGDTLKLAGLGQLTEDGKQNSYKLGTLLKSRYRTLVGNVYNPEFVIAQSSGTERTNATAQLVLQGLFSQSPQDSTNAGPLNGFKIITKDYELKLVNSYCPAYTEELNRTLDSAESKRLLKENENLLNIILQFSGKAYRSLREILFLFGALASEKAANLTLPEWAERVYQDLQKLAVMQLQYENGNDFLKRLNGGRMLRKVLDGMEGLIVKTFKSDSAKMVLYSCHDFNIAAILSTLNLFEPHYPQFNSAVAIELYSDAKGNEHYVKVVYIKNINVDAQELSMTNCSTMCEFYEFKKIVGNNLPVNYTKECNSNIVLD